MTGGHDALHESLHLRSESVVRAPHELHGQRRDLSGLHMDARSRRFDHGKSRREADADSTRGIGQEERRARHVDGRNGAHAMALEKGIEQPPPLAARGETQDRFVAQPFAQRTTFTAPTWEIGRASCRERVLCVV